MFWPSNSPATQSKRGGCKIAVIIPTLNEERNVRRAISSAQAGGAHSIEVVVADHGSTDGTVQVAKSCKAKVVRCKQKGRGQQLNAGAAATSGHIYLFLHADSTLPANYADTVCNAVMGSQKGENQKGRRAQWGCFESIQLQPAIRGGWLLSTAVMLRTRLLGIPYGDQALFTTADTYRQLGGFNPLPLMEDVDFVRRAHKAKLRMAIIPQKVTTSARRWQKLGLVKTTVLNQGEGQTSKRRNGDAVFPLCS